MHIHTMILIQLTAILDAHSKLVICAGFSLIEAVFGSEGLKVLMASKGKIDPSNLFSDSFFTHVNLLS